MTISFNNFNIIDLGIPRWVLFLIGVIAVVVIWKLIKFAIKIALIIIVFLLILFGLDALGVFDKIQGLLSGFI
ncbi:MAG: hypothetical protein DRM99_03555 [Thermoplasmata archaeon]|nr:MAG: hypothetical protein DRM99_03555 [Thermoplasmata archaeon]RLF51932.1 MAG: hypothetical protein DRN24_04080 [Thermoplasmata archaeon]